MKPSETIPQSIESEQAVIGAMLIDPDCIFKVNAIVSLTDFYLSKNREIYEAILALHTQRVKVDFVTLTERLENSGKLELIGGMAYVSSLLSCVPSALNVEHYARSVKETAIRRAMLDSVSDIARAAYDETRPVSECLSEASASIARLNTTASHNTGHKADAGAFAVLARSEYYRRNPLRPGEVRGISTGYPDVNAMMGGFLRGYVYYLLGVEHCGKTWVCLNLAANVAREGGRVLFFSLEMSADTDPEEYQSSTLWERLVLMEIGMTISEYRNGAIAERDYPRFTNGIQEVSAWDFTIYDNVRRYEDISAIVQREQHVKPLDLVVIDYLKLITPPSGSGRAQQTRQEGLGQLTGALKGLATDNHIALFVPHQISSKQLAGRTEKRPRLEDGYYTGDLGQDADVVLGLYRPDLYDSVDAQRAASAANGVAMEWEKLKDRPSGGTGDWAKLWFSKTGKIGSFVRPGAADSERF